jgi:hypothetical protein
MWIGHAACSPDNRLLAVQGSRPGAIRLIENASGCVRAEFEDHRHAARELAFSPDGKTLASGGRDTVVFLWDVTGARTGPAVKDASDRELAAWWADLASEDGKRAGDAVASLIRTSDRGAAMLREWLRPAEPVEGKRLARLIAELDAGSFAKREAAKRELAQQGELAEAALRTALQGKPSLELKRRLEALLEPLERNQLTPETLQALRAVEVLEHIGTPAAREVLRSLAQGTPEARLTREAKAALARGRTEK